MRFHVDVQIHSKYSRATAKNADLEHLALWGLKKGVTIVGTGDFTHPAWLADIKEKLVPAEPGLFRLRPDIEKEVERQAPAACAGPVRFMLEVEISTIYKKGDKVRKIHHLIFVPDLAAADRLVASLSRIGNLASDGRPILGLDSRDLLEIALETGPHSYLIPAHIWTPWFAALGSKSGFDSIDACYGDLAEHVFAVETGLSSDPEMNWRISSLDRFRLVSNSDAHSPPKIGREATTYDTALDYFAILDGLKTGEGFVGTVEFFPEEGKYHLDGHRKCGVRFTPEETRAHGGNCPVCGAPLTVGVLHRVDALADRPADQVPPPPKAGEVLSLVPLTEILSEIKGVGPTSKTVVQSYERLLARLGPELSILETVPLEDIAQADTPILAEAISRLRAGKVVRESGYDGEYGVIHLFEEDELRRHKGGGLLFDLPASLVGNRVHSPQREIPRRQEGETPPQPETRRDHAPPHSPTASRPLAGLDDAQRAAAETVQGALLIVAGPGSGKTRALTHRIAHLIAECGAAPEACLAITFTRRAAAEMTERLAALAPSAWAAIPVHTFHSLGLSILREHPDAAGLYEGFRIADEEARVAMLAENLDVSGRKARTLLRAVSVAKRTGRPASNEAAEALAAYQRALATRNWIDFDDMVGLAAAALDADPGLAALYRDRFRWISVDEFQDVDAQQYRLVKLLAPPDANLCVIGDSNQAIYGFRGADASCFHRFTEDYATAAVVRLDRNYRSSGTIVTASSQVIAPETDGDGAGQAMRDMRERVTIHTARTERAEAEFVVQAIEGMIGGHSFFSIDSGRGADGAGAELSFSDFAILYRTDAQSAVLSEALARSGMPFGKHGHAPLADAPAVRSLLEELDADAGNARLAVRLTEAAGRLASTRGAPDAGLLGAALQQLLALAETCGGDLARFADAVALASEADGWDPRADRISLLTLHAAKGLEFPVVFIVGIEDGILPLRWGGRDDTAMEEERRLFYVGMTRAKDRLFLCRAEKRSWRGAPRTLPASPFLSDIETALLEHSRMAALPRRDPDRQLDLF
jgi:DNA helicase-2/ATP-dependent DNA helicase PcrA